MSGLQVDALQQELADVRAAAQQAAAHSQLELHQARQAAASMGSKLAVQAQELGAVHARASDLRVQLEVREAVRTIENTASLACGSLEVESTTVHHALHLFNLTKALNRAGFAFQ
jgi:hypothetical protein